MVRSKKSVKAYVFSQALALVALVAVLSGGSRRDSMAMATTSYVGQYQCAQVFAPKSARRQVRDEDVLALAKNEGTRTILKSLQAFADRHHLDERLIEVGPPEKRMKRLVVAIDISNEALVKDYVATFNLEREVDATAGHPSGVRTLALEFQKEIEGEYVFGGLRTGSQINTRDGLWRWGKLSTESHTNWFMWSPIEPRTQFAGFGHLIPVTNQEASNVNYYLQHPLERGPCKSDNCIAWTTGIELGETGLNKTSEERRILFNELGVSRSIAHFEIARRLVHAANERHVAMVAFVKGSQGLENFRTLESILPPEPQQPLRDIMKGLPKDAETPAVKAMSLVPDGAKVFFPIAAGASPEGMSALIERTASLSKGVDVHVLVNGISEALLERGVQTSNGKFRLHALFLGGNVRKLNREGKVSVIPGYLSDFTRHVSDPTRPEFHYDAMVVRVAPKDEAGRYSLGPNNDMILSILRERPEIKVIAEVNPNVPRTIGDNFLLETQIAAKFESRSALAGPAVLPLSDAEITIGRELGRLIPSDSTLQVGIGNIFGGLPEGMRDAGSRRVRIFTEMFGDPMMEMIKMGLVGQAETGFAYGSGELYRWLDQNPKVKIVETEYVNDPGLVARTNGFHAVNTALQVTLRGDVNATHGADGFRISSPGGQVEFMSGAARSRGGKAIIAIRSTAKQGLISSITLDTYGGNVTTPHESVTHVVTEYGVAVLVGKSESERAAAMIRIAHPTFRPELISQALARGMINAETAQSLR